VDNFRWHDWNLAKVAKHGVSQMEAERVVVNAKTPYPRKLGNDKWQVVGRGQGDRLVQVGYVVDLTEQVLSFMRCRCDGGKEKQ
jgi:uncharacterized DUF497 family protein